MAVPSNWHDWDDAVWRTEASEWGDMWYYFTCPQYGDYFLEAHDHYILINTFIAIQLIKDKCNAMQVQIDAMGEPTELNMDTILTAMWDSDKLRWFHFVNYIDSMRAGIWNTEIYEKHLADWYIHFSA